MAFIEDRGNRSGKRWRVRYRDPEGRERSRSFARQDEARAFKAEQESKLIKGEWLDPNAGKVSFSEWSARWLAGLHSLKPKTLAGYESLLKTRVLPMFGGIELRKITPALVREWQTSMLDEVSPARVRQARQVLSAALEVAVVDGVLRSNPCAKVKPPTVRNRRQLFLTVAEVHALAAAAEARQTGAGALVLFLAYSGLRWGEAIALRWERIDTDRGRVEVVEAVTEVRGKLEWGTPKSHETRTFPLAPQAIDALDGLRGTLEGAPDALVFTAPRGGVLRNSNFRSSVWLRAVEASGVPDGLHVHDLRHTAAAIAIASGASIKAVQRMLGHASAAMTLDRYGHLFEQDMEDLADRMGRYIDAQAEASNVVALRR